MNVPQLTLASLNNHHLFTFLDLAGTFAFAISGAVAARDRGLDWFGVIVVAFAVACGGGVLRDLCIGAVPPAGLTDWRYLAIVMAAAFMTMATSGLVARLANPVLLFDTVGLGLFAVTGAQKTMIFGHNAEVAVLLGVVTAVGGGVIRDVLLNRVPAILQRDIYASAALVGAVIVVGAKTLGWGTDWSPWLAMAVCIGLRYFSLRYHWNLPTYAGSGSPKPPSAH